MFAFSSISHRGRLTEVYILCLCLLDMLALLLQTFWHSSAHVLGQVLELEFGVDLTIGPALEEGFYYDCFMGDKVRPLVSHQSKSNSSSGSSSPCRAWPAAAAAAESAVAAGPPGRQATSARRAGQHPCHQQQAVQPWGARKNNKRLGCCSSSAAGAVGFVSEHSVLVRLCWAAWTVSC